MTSGKNDFRTSRLIFNRHNIDADAISDGVVLRNDSLARRDAAFKFTKVNHDVAFFKSANSSTNNVTSTVFILVVNHFLLSHAKTLHHCLFGRLGCNTTKVFGRHIEVHCVA